MTIVYAKSAMHIIQETENMHCRLGSKQVEPYLLIVSVVFL